MNVLCIGNSFSEDATKYLHQIARADGHDIKVVNLFIGGCPLSRHFKNAMTDAKRYNLIFNGMTTNFLVSIKDALNVYEYDYVTFQQASGLSVDYSTYQPYLNRLVEYVDKYAPEAKRLVHQTWAYEQGSQLLHNSMGYKDQKDMFNDLKCAYEKAAEQINAEFILPSGEVLQELIKKGAKVHRDGLHTSFGLGRYAMALTWYKMLTGADLSGNTFRDFDVSVSEEEVELAKKCATIVAEKYSK